MNNTYDKFLPIGTIVLLKNGKKRLMITGFCVRTNDKDSKMYDYSGCLYPEGILTTEQIAMFNHDQIDKIFSVGYSDEEERFFKEKLKEELTKIGE